jgi:hypothetical protein
MSATRIRGSPLPFRQLSTSAAATTRRPGSRRPARGGVFAQEKGEQEEEEEPSPPLPSPEDICGQAEGTPELKLTYPECIHIIIHCSTSFWL